MEELVNAKKQRHGTKVHGVLQLVTKDYVRYPSLMINVKESTTDIHLVLNLGAGMKEGLPNVLLFQVCLIYIFLVFVISVDI